MKNYFWICLMIVGVGILFAGCNSVENLGLKSEDSNLDYRLMRIALKDEIPGLVRDDVEVDTNNQILEFTFYLERPDMGLKQPDNAGILTVSDLELELQPMEIKLMSLGGEELNYSCSKEELPHSCRVDFREQDIQITDAKYKLSVMFSDNSKAEAVISIPLPEMLERDIFVSKEDLENMADDSDAMPEDNDEDVEDEEILDRDGYLELYLRDNGADLFEINVVYGGPEDEFAQSAFYIIMRDERGLYLDQEKSNKDNPGVEVAEDGIIVLTSDFQIADPKKASFMIKSTKTDELEGIETLVSVISMDQNF